MVRGKMGTTVLQPLVFADVRLTRLCRQAEHLPQGSYKPLIPYRSAMQALWKPTHLYLASTVRDLHEATWNYEEIRGPNYNYGL